MPKASADYTAQNLTTSEPMFFISLEKIFCVAFTIELMLRLIVHRASFFCGSGCAWNLFDFFVVVLQLVEEIMWLMAVGLLGITGVLRLLRLVRIVRLARILRLIRELRILVTSITTSMKSLMWTLLLMFLIIYSVSLCITQVLSGNVGGRLSSIDGAGGTAPKFDGGGAQHADNIALARLGIKRISVPAAPIPRREAEHLGSGAGRVGLTPGPCHLLSGPDGLRRWGMP